MAPDHAAIERLRNAVASGDGIEALRRLRTATDGVCWLCRAQCRHPKGVRLNDGRYVCSGCAALLEEPTEWIPQPLPPRREFIPPPSPPSMSRFDLGLALGCGIQLLMISIGLGGLLGRISPALVAIPPLAALACALALFARTWGEHRKALTKYREDEPALMREYQQKLAKQERELEEYERSEQKRLWELIWEVRRDVYDWWPDYPPDWDHRRSKVRYRDNRRCVICGSHGSRSHPLHTHHVKALGLGGSNRLSNLVTLCEDCHRAQPGHSDL